MKQWIWLSDVMKRSDGAWHQVGVTAQHRAREKSHRRYPERCQKNDWRHASGSAHDETAYKNTQNVENVPAGQRGSGRLQQADEPR